MQHFHNSQNNNCCYPENIRERTKNWNFSINKQESTNLDFESSFGHISALRPDLVVRISRFSRRPPHLWWKTDKQYPKNCFQKAKPEPSTQIPTTKDQSNYVFRYPFEIKIQRCQIWGTQLRCWQKPRIDQS